MHSSSSFSFWLLVPRSLPTPTPLPHIVAFSNSPTVHIYTKWLISKKRIIGLRRWVSETLKSLGYCALCRPKKKKRKEKIETGEHTFSKFKAIINKFVPMYTPGRGGEKPETLQLESNER